MSTVYLSADYAASECTVYDAHLSTVVASNFFMAAIFAAGIVVVAAAVIVAACHFCWLLPLLKR